MDEILGKEKEQVVVVRIKEVDESLQQEAWEEVNRHFIVTMVSAPLIE